MLMAWRCYLYVGGPFKPGEDQLRPGGSAWLGPGETKGLASWDLVLFRSLRPQT
jgi:hypothetical protein